MTQAKQRHIKPIVKLFDVKGIEKDISNSIQSINIQKDVDRPVATAQLVLNPKRIGNNSTTITSSQLISHLKRFVRVNSIISIKMDETFKKHSFLGFVDHVFEGVVSQNNSTQRTLNINCSMLLPKLLVRDGIVNSPILSSNSKIKEELGKRVEFFNWMRGLDPKTGKSPFVGKPEEAVKWILNNMPSTNTDMGISYDVDDDGFVESHSPKKFFNPKVTDVDDKSVLDFQFLNGELLFSPQLSRFSGSILNYIYESIDKEFYEVFFDTTTGKDGLPYNKMVIRPKPFSFLDYKKGKEFKAIDNWLYWEQLDWLGDAVEVSSKVRLTENLGVNDYEVKNMFFINFTKSLIAGSNSVLGKFGLQFPVVNIEGIKRYGIRDITVPSTMINFDRVIEKHNTLLEKAKNSNTPIPSISDLISDKEKGELHYLLAKREKVVEWNAFPYYESGQMQIVGDERITIGKKLIYKDKKYYDVESHKEYTGVEYYIKGVTESYSYGGFYTQNLRLSRGIPKGVAVKWLNENRPKFVGIDSLEQSSSSNQSTEIPSIDTKEVYDKREERQKNAFTIVPPSIE